MTSDPVPSLTASTPDNLTTAPPALLSVAPPPVAVPPPPEAVSAPPVKVTPSEGAPVSVAPPQPAPIIHAARVSLVRTPPLDMRAAFPMTAAYVEVDGGPAAIVAIDRSLALVFAPGVDNSVLAGIKSKIVPAANPLDPSYALTFARAAEMLAKVAAGLRATAAAASPLGGVSTSDKI